MKLYALFAANAAIGFVIFSTIGSLMVASKLGDGMGMFVMSVGGGILVPMGIACGVMFARALDPKTTKSPHPQPKG